MKLFLPFLLLSATALITSSNQILKINQAVTGRFEKDVNKLSAIMEEIKRRKGIEGQPTLVAFGTPQNAVERADYWITYAHEALAFQKVQKFSTKQDLKYSLQVLANKILRAKAEVKKAL